MTARRTWKVRMTTFPLALLVLASQVADHDVIFRRRCRLQVVANRKPELRDEILHLFRHPPGLSPPEFRSHDFERVGPPITAEVIEQRRTLASEQKLVGLPEPLNLFVFIDAELAIKESLGQCAGSGTTASLSIQPRSLGLRRGSGERSFQAVEFIEWHTPASYRSKLGFYRYSRQPTFVSQVRLSLRNRKPTLTFLPCI